MRALVFIVLIVFPLSVLFLEERTRQMQMCGPPAGFSGSNVCFKQLIKLGKT
jgi:hypothetical protein